MFVSQGKNFVCSDSAPGDSGARPCASPAPGPAAGARQGRGVAGAWAAGRPPYPPEMALDWRPTRRSALTCPAPVAGRCRRPYAHARGPHDISLSSPPWGRLPGVRVGAVEAPSPGPALGRRRPSLLFVALARRSGARPGRSEKTGDAQPFRQGGPGGQAVRPRLSLPVKTLQPAPSPPAR